MVWEVRCGCFADVTASDIVQSDDFTVFTDINPSAQHHLQIVPKKHIGNLASSPIVNTMVDNHVVESVKSLDASDVQMGMTTSCIEVLSLSVIAVKEMLEIGHEVLDKLDVPPHLRRLVFVYQQRP